MRERPDMEVRLLREEDIEDVIAVWHDTRKETHTSMNIEAERDVTLDDSRRIFQENIASRCQLCWPFADRTSIGCM